MAITERDQDIWTLLFFHIGNAYGTAALMGNLYAESSMNPQKMTGANAKGVPADLYINDVDSGIITKSEFAHDGIAFGLVQWLFYTRKEALYDYAKSLSMSIGDYRMQINYTLKEIREHYKTVWNALCEATNIKDASDIVLTRYEKPANTSDSVKKKRADYGQVYYDRFVHSVDPSPTPEPQPEPTPEPVEKIAYIRTTQPRVFIRTGNDKKYTAVTRVESDGTEFKWIATADNGWHAIEYGKSVKAVYWISGDYSEKIFK